MIHLKHRTCSGDLSRCWEYDSARRCVILAFDGRGVDVPVATEVCPRQGSYSIRRIDSSSWEISPSVFTHRGSHWASHIAAYPDGAMPAMTVLLSGAPDNVSAEMGELFYEPCPEPDNE